MTPELKLREVASLVALSDKDVVRHWRRWHEAETGRVMPLYPPPVAQMLRDLIAATLEPGTPWHLAATTSLEE